tara:strand:- start:317 stop:616 length:300 start_codon:yes stop_codon:yes gene_type:complete
MNPFDFAWAVLKSHDDEFPPMPFYSSTDQGYDPERTQGKGGKVYHHPEPEYPPEEAPEEMEPSLEESQAMAPDVDAEEVLSRLSPEEAEALRNHFSGGQ